MSIYRSFSSPVFHIHDSKYVFFLFFFLLIKPFFYSSLSFRITHWKTPTSLYLLIHSFVDPMPLLTIFFHALQKPLLSLDKRKAYVLNGIPPSLLKGRVSEIALVLARLFHFCLKTKNFASSWKHSPSQRTDTILTLPAIVLLLRLLLSPWSLNLSINVSLSLSLRSQLWCSQGMIYLWYPLLHH